MLAWKCLLIVISERHLSMPRGFYPQELPRKMLREPTMEGSGDQLRPPVCMANVLLLSSLSSPGKGLEYKWKCLRMGSEGHSGLRKQCSQLSLPKAGTSGHFSTAGKVLVLLITDPSWVPSTAYGSSKSHQMWSLSTELRVKSESCCVWSPNGKKSPQNKNPKW